MKIGVSSYSFNQAIHAGRITLYEAIDEAARLGYQSMDFSVLILNGETPLQAAPKIKQRAKDAGIEVTNYAVGADLLLEGLPTEIKRLHSELEVAAEIGARTFRHDATAGRREKGGKLLPYPDALPELAEGYLRVTERAKELGIRTMVENHGYYCQDSERVEALVRAVGHPNFGVLLDIGNFACADEDPIGAVSRLAAYAFHVHAKDFHRKSASVDSPGLGWFSTRSGAHLRGAIIGHGEIPVSQCLQIVEQTGYDGVVAVEFEGIEDCLMAVAECKKNLDKMIPVG